MAIELTCSYCSRAMRAPDHVGGKHVSCPHCQTINAVALLAEVVLDRPISSVPGRNLVDDFALRLLLPVGRSGWAIAAGYMGLFATLLLPAPLAIVLGVIAIVHLRLNPKLHGWGRAIFGLVMGVVCTILLVILPALAGR